MRAACVITTISAPTPAMATWASSFEVIVAPDLKTPMGEYEHSPYRMVGDAGEYGLTGLPSNHYCRKMLGYLEAARSGAECIIDTDDDTFLTEGASPFDALSAPVRHAVSTSDFVNIYALRTGNARLWPRGLPLTDLGQTPSYVTIDDPLTIGQPAVIQFLIGGDTDVDAIHRLVFGVRDVEFEETGFLDLIPPGYFCPFNSQLTLWSLPLLPLMYLPSTVTFRFTDILRGVVAKRVLDAQGLSMAFADSVGYQVRNPHDYMRDFESEIPCYLQTSTAWTVVGEALTAGLDASAQLVQAYEALARAGICAESELDLVDQWVRACGLC